jgi:hypothetical protein
MLEFKSARSTFLARFFRSHCVTQHGVEMFDRQCTEKNNFKQFFPSVRIFSRICPTFHQSSHSLIPIGVEEYSEQVNQVALNGIFSFQLALSQSQGSIVSQEMFVVEDRKPFSGQSVVCMQLRQSPAFGHDGQKLR